jgi:hypothetical protein
MVPFEGPLPAGGIAFLSLERGRGGWRQAAALGGVGVHGRGAGGGAGPACGCQRRPGLRDTRTALCQAGGRRRPGLLSLTGPGDPRANGSLLSWLGGVASAAALLRSVGAAKGQGWRPEAGDAGCTPRSPASPGRQTTRRWLQLPRRHFLPEQPGSSVLCQPRLRAPCLLFSKQAPQRSRGLSLRADWARVPLMEPEPEPERSALRPPTAPVAAAPACAASGAPSPPLLTVDQFLPAPTHDSMLSVGLLNYSCQIVTAYLHFLEENSTFASA